jgi:lipoprotein-anchoring transpeptidase ErfK/SrfK
MFDPRISRRGFVFSALAAGLVPATAAQADEPFPVRTGDLKRVEYKYRRRDTEFDTAEPAGTLVVDPNKKILFHVLGNGQATRYGVSVGKVSKSWKGEVVIKKMAKWPTWTPAPYHIAGKPELAKWLPGGMPGGPDNPMGARAMYLYRGEVDTVDRIHGGAKVSEIGRRATAGCIGMLDADIIHLYDNITVGTRVVMLG